MNWKSKRDEVLEQRQFRGGWAMATRVYDNNDDLHDTLGLPLTMETAHACACDGHCSFVLVVRSLDFPEAVERYFHY
jgi:hypothetical protein